MWKASIVTSRERAEVGADLAAGRGGRGGGIAICDWVNADVRVFSILCVAWSYASSDSGSAMGKNGWATSCASLCSEEDMHDVHKS